MLFWFLVALNELIFFFFLGDSDKICDLPLPTFLIPLLCRRQGLYDKILMTMDLHNNVRHQHIFNKAMHLLRRAVGWNSLNESLRCLRSWLSRIEAAPEKIPLSCSTCQMKWGFMNHCQENYITGCKLKLGFNIYATLGWRI